MGCPHDFRVAEGITDGPLLGLVATQSLMSRGLNKQAPTIGPVGYTTPGVYGGPQGFSVDNKISSGPKLGLVTT